MYASLCSPNLVERFKASYNHCLLHRVRPKPFFGAFLIWRRIYYPLSNEGEALPVVSNS